MSSHFRALVSSLNLVLGCKHQNLTPNTNGTCEKVTGGSQDIEGLEVRFGSQAGPWLMWVLSIRPHCLLQCAVCGKGE